MRFFDGSETLHEPLQMQQVTPHWKRLPQAGTGIQMRVSLNVVDRLLMPWRMPGVQVSEWQKNQP